MHSCQQQIPLLGLPHIGCSSKTEAVSNFHAFIQHGRRFQPTCSLYVRELVVIAAEALNPHGLYSETGKFLSVFTANTTFCSAPWQQLQARGNHSSKLHLALCYWAMPITQLANKVHSIVSEAEQ